MPDIFEYLYWRGDLSFSSCPLNGVDSLLLCRLSYLPFDEVVPGSFADSLTLRDAAPLLLQRVDAGEAVFRKKEDRALLDAMASSDRFGGLSLTGYRNRHDAEQTEQFAAVTLCGPEGAYIAFRGTDATIVGWKEDFNLCFQSAVAAQTDAARYLWEAARACPGILYVGGHSKGGNLAVYAAAHAEWTDAAPEADPDTEATGVSLSAPSPFPGTDARIQRVFNHDGPGFLSQTLQGEGFRRILPRVLTFVPQSSVVGMLLEHEEDFLVVHSTKTGLFQHDLYSWEVTPTGFVLDESLTNSSQMIDATLKQWLTRMTPEVRERFVEGVFGLLTSTDAETLRQLWQGRNTLALLRAYREMDPATRADIATAFSLLRESIKSEGILSFRSINAI